MRRIAVITGSRADESPLSNVIRLLGDNAIHIKTEGLYGHEEAIRRTLTEAKPDIVCLLGDRYETLVAASVAALQTIPIAHIHGGEETLGAVDSAFRHAITKLSYYHFTAHQDYAARVIQMGESPDRVFVTGAPGVDQYDQVEDSIFSKRPLAVVCYHPETLGTDAENLALIKTKLAGVGSYIVSTVNADIGNQTIKDFWKAEGIEPQQYRQDEWVSFMRHADILIGNSSCFILEGMMLGKKVINIGDRQEGRYEAALRHFAADKYAYGKPGEVSPKIAQLLMTLPIPEKPRKVFYDSHN